MEIKQRETSYLIPEVELEISFLVQVIHRGNELRKTVRKCKKQDWTESLGFYYQHQIQGNIPQCYT